MGGQAGQGGQSQGAPMQQPAAQMPDNSQECLRVRVSQWLRLLVCNSFNKALVATIILRLAAKMKKLTGWDPNEQTPDQKRAAEIQQFREKEEIKKQMKGGADLTGADKSNYNLKSRYCECREQYSSANKAIRKSRCSASAI